MVRDPETRADIGEPGEPEPAEPETEEPAAAEDSDEAPEADPDA